jgi:hypothetical protein
MLVWCSACAQFCPMLLSEQTVSCFGNIADFQHLATTIALSESRPPSIVWNRDMTRLTYQGHSVIITDLRE